MSILDVFRPSTQELPVTQVTPAAATEVIPAEIPAQDIKLEAKNPMDEFNDLWETKVEDPKVIPESDAFAINPEALMKAAREVNFGQVVTPELLTTINAGGEDATKAMLSAMNSMSQAVYAQSAAAATKITEAAYKKAEVKLLANIDQRIKSANTTSNLMEENPILNHSATKPIIAALQSQIAQKFPNSTAVEQVAMAKKYLLEFSGAINPVQAPKEATPEFDWNDFLEE